jgi:hypothetical protein
MRSRTATIDSLLIAVQLVQDIVAMLKKKLTQLLANLNEI